MRVCVQVTFPLLHFHLHVEVEHWKLSLCVCCCVYMVWERSCKCKCCSVWMWSCRQRQSSFCSSMTERKRPLCSAAPEMAAGTQRGWAGGKEARSGSQLRTGSGSGFTLWYKVINQTERCRRAVFYMSDRFIQPEERLLEFLLSFYWNQRRKLKFLLHHIMMKHAE